MVQPRIRHVTLLGLGSVVLSPFAFGIMIDCQPITVPDDAVYLAQSETLCAAPLDHEVIWATWRRWDQLPNANANGGSVEFTAQGAAPSPGMILAFWNSIARRAPLRVNHGAYLQVFLPPDLGNESPQQITPITHEGHGAKKGASAQNIYAFSPGLPDTDSQLLAVRLSATPLALTQARNSIIPEPATTTLLCLGALGMGIHRRWHHRYMEERIAA